MIYREIGKTGERASVIGLGCEQLDGKPYSQVEETIRTALEYGVNHLDVFMPGREVRENIAKALGSQREKVHIQGHIGSTDVGQQYDISRDMPTVKKYFEDCLRIFGYIDYGMMFFIDSEEDYRQVFDGGIADYAQKLKQAGDIRHIGFSSHDPVIAAKIVETGLPEIMLFSINLAFDMSPADKSVLKALEGEWHAEEAKGIDPKRAALYRLCEQKGVGISVMKALGSGKLISAEHTPFSEPMTVNQCIHYALDRPAVCSVLLGCQTGDEVKDAMMYLEASDEEKDYTRFLDAMESDFRGNCVYCGHCAPCPAGIDIAAVNKYLDIALLDTGKVPPSIRSHYDCLSAHGGDCIECGSCEKRCPFDVSVIEKMKEAAEIFGK